MKLNHPTRRRVMEKDWKLDGEGKPPRQPETYKEVCRVVGMTQEENADYQATLSSTDYLNAVGEKGGGNQTLVSGDKGGNTGVKCGVCHFEDHYTAICPQKAADIRGESGTLWTLYHTKGVVCQLCGRPGHKKEHHMKAAEDYAAIQRGEEPGKKPSKPGGGGGGGGGAGGANTSSSNNVSAPGTVYTGSPSSGRGWNQNWGPNGIPQSPGAFYDGVVYGPAGGPNTTSLSQTSPPGTGTIARGNPLGDPGPHTSHTKRFNVSSANYTQTNTTPGGAGGGGGNGYGYQGDNTAVVNAESGASGSSPGGAAGGDGGGAGAAGGAGSNSPAATGGAAGAGGNALTSPGSVNYTVSNTGTINGSQG